MSDSIAKTKAESTASGKPAGQKESSMNCVVAQGTKIEGNFKSPENIRLDGTLIGDIQCDKKMVLGETGKIEGKIWASDAVIMGQVMGELEIKGTLHLVSTALITGNVNANKIIIEEGAQFNGECRIGKA